MSSVRGHWPGLVAGVTGVGLALALAVGGCSSPDAENTGSGTAGRPALDSKGDAPAAAPAPGAERPGAPAEPGGAGGRLAVDRAIIYNGSITVRVDKVDEAAARATTIVTTAGGFVGADKRSRNDRRSEASLELRVPAARFTSVVDQLAQLGDEEQRGIDTEDVTEAVVDLDARILTQQASVNRTRALLAQAKTVGEIVSIESELAKREAELASLQAKKRRLADLTTLSTITLVLLGPDADAPKPDDEPDTGFIAGLKAGWKAFLASMEVLLTVVGALLPWLLALGLPIYALVWLTRRLARRSRPAHGVIPAPAMAAAGPAPTGPSPTGPGAVGPLPPPPPPRQTPPPPPRPTTQPPTQPPSPE